MLERHDSARFKPRTQQLRPNCRKCASLRIRRNANCHNWRLILAQAVRHRLLSGKHFLGGRTTRMIGSLRMKGAVRGCRRKLRHFGGALTTRTSRPQCTKITFRGSQAELVDSSLRQYPPGIAGLRGARFRPSWLSSRALPRCRRCLGRFSGWLRFDSQ
jgi:hypothetical protein